MASTLRGVIHGKTIEPANDPGIEEGRRVEVTRFMADEVARLKEILRTAGSMANDPEFDAIMAQVPQERHADALKIGINTSSYKTIPRDANTGNGPNGADSRGIL